MLRQPLLSQRQETHQDDEELLSTCAQNPALIVCLQTVVTLSNLCGLANINCVFFAVGNATFIIMTIMGAKQRWHPDLTQILAEKVPFAADGN